jgi:hypothetical protein
MVSPLAKQKELEDFQNSQIWYENVKSLPEGIGVLSAKQEDLPRYWATKLDVPMELVRDKKEIDAKMPALIELFMSQMGQGGMGGQTQV